MQSLYSCDTLIKVTVVNRPSKQIKSPYVADVMLEDGTTALCHTPGLGCSGLVATGRVIYVSKSKSAKAKTEYSAQISESRDSEGDYYIGIQPMVSQSIAQKLLDKINSNLVWRSEVKINEHTRLDFVGRNPETGKNTYVEVKNAMISLDTQDRKYRRAIFPEGFRKSKKDPISPRAVKHAETLAELSMLPDTEDAYLLFIVPRDDCEGGLELNVEDPIYCNAVRNAVAKGVKIRVFGLKWLQSGVAYFSNELAFKIPDT